MLKRVNIHQTDTSDQPPNMSLSFSLSLSIYIYKDIEQTNNPPTHIPTQVVCGLKDQRMNSWVHSHKKNFILWKNWVQKFL